MSCTTSTSSFSFTLPSTTTPEHAKQSGQYDLLQEQSSAWSTSSKQRPLEKHRYQEPPCRENQQRGGNPRNTFSTGYEPKELALVSRLIDPYQLYDIQKECREQDHQAPIHEEVTLEKLRHTAYRITKAMILKYQGRPTFKSNMHSDDSAESITDYDLEHGELQKMLTSPLYVQIASVKPDALVVLEEVSAKLIVGTEQFEESFISGSESFCETRCMNYLLGPMTWKITRRNVWKDIANLRKQRLNNYAKL